MVLSSSCFSYNSNMDTMIYLTLERKENAGETKDAPPVFSIKERPESAEESLEYRLLYVDVPRAMLKEPQEKKGTQNQEDRACENRGVNLKKGQEGKRSILEWVGSLLGRGPEPTPQSSGHDVRESEVITAHENKIKEIIAQERKKAFRREALLLNLPWIRELSEYLVPYQLQSDACSMVYDDSVDKWLKKYDLCGWWEENWPIPLFEGYHAPILARKLMEHVHLSHFLVLGYAPCVPELLVSHARRMKSLRFLLREMPEELDLFLEDFYEEYGLAAACRVTDGESFKGERIQCAVPTAILDFSGESHLLTADVVKGSMWLDMDSMEEKRRRIEDRNTGIFYFSMKKEWKRTIRP